MFLISDNVDTSVGLRLAGISGVVVHEKEEIEKALQDALDNPSIGIVVLTEKNAKIASDMLDDIKSNYTLPLVVVVPDRHGQTGESSISRYVSSIVDV